MTIDTIDVHVSRLGSNMNRRKQLTDEQLLAEVEDLLRNMPDRSKIRHLEDENFAWLGRVGAALSAWDLVRGGMMKLAIGNVHGGTANAAHNAFNEIIVTLHQARSDLRMSSIGPTNIAINKGGVFDYFDEIRKIIESATSGVLFVDPYLDAEFVSNYLGHVSSGVNVRLLACEKLVTLIPAVALFSKQSRLNVEVRSNNDFHDRFIFIDGNCCYQSGASFKDGAKNTPTTLTQITDAFVAMQQTYETIWDRSKIET